jgi:hypothetical protein
MDENNHRNVIIETLKQHPEGLTISSIANLTGLHRHTSRKYINELIRVGEIIQRSVGAAKLCYLKNINNEKIFEKKSFFQKFNLKLIISVVLATFLLSEVVILAYENNSLNETLTDNGSINTSPLTSSIILNDSNISQMIETAIENSSNATVEINDSLIPVENLTPSENTSIESHPKMNITLDFPQRITRGEEFKVKAYATNIGSLTAKNVVINWQLPNSLEIVSDSSNCTDLEPNSVCNSEITVKSNVSAELGVNDLKIVVNYEE